MTNRTQDERKDDLIKENLRRAFDDKATEELPSELMALLDQLRGQDEQNSKK